MLKYNFIKYTIVSILLNAFAFGSLGLNINIHQCSQGKNVFAKVILPWTTDNNCDLCHVEEKIEIVKEVHPCCQTEQVEVEKKNKKEEKKDCCKEKEFTVKNDIQVFKSISSNFIKIDTKLNHQVNYINTKLNNLSLFNLILIPPNIRLAIQSLTI